MTTIRSGIKKSQTKSDIYYKASRTLTPQQHGDQQHVNITHSQ